jgi:hypothetical protein
MRQGLTRQSPALVVAVLALFVALGGSVYAAKRARINGKAIRAKSIPGNRLKPHSVAANRLKPHSIAGSQLKPHSITVEQLKTEIGPEVIKVGMKLPLTGDEINELTLSQVPSAAHADSADTATSAATAQSALDAQTALNAVNAVDAQTVNGYGVGCLPATLHFAGACWDSSAQEAVDAPTAARRCAQRGGELPGALALAAFAEQPGVHLSIEDEWSGDIPVLTGPNTYGVATVSTSSEIDSSLSTTTHQYHCVFPLLNDS